MTGILRSLLESGQTPVAEQLLMAGTSPLACTVQHCNQAHCGTNTTAGCSTGSMANAICFKRDGLVPTLSPTNRLAGAGS